MKKSIIIDRDNGFKPMDERVFEIVERKGDGHPDTICDSVVNACASKLSQMYIQQYNKPQHYNLDKAFLIAGKSKPVLGKSNPLEQPMRLLIGDRATKLREFTVDDIIIDAATDFMIKFKHVDKEDFVVEPVAAEGSAHLRSLFGDKRKMGANDTSATVGYAPLSRVENTVHTIEGVIKTLGVREPAIGEDVKIMAVRDHDRIDVTVAIAMVAQALDSLDDYVEVKNCAHGLIIESLRNWKQATVTINALDNHETGDIYITETGLSSECGDSGQVGRGNNLMGVIPLCRPASAEAEAGKNADSHVGKIYSKLAFEMANAIHGETGVENYVWMVSRIGKPITEPTYVYVELCDIYSTNNTLYTANAIVEDYLNRWLDIDYF